MRRTPAERSSTPRPALATTTAQRARRQRIIATATALLEEREYDQIQIRDVAEGAGVALGTLYRYFPSKEQLFAHVLLEWGRGLRRRAPRPSTSRDRLATTLRRAARAYERNPNFFRLLTVLEVARDPEVSATFSEFAELIRRALEDSLVDVEEHDAEVITGIALAELSILLRGWAVGAVSMRFVYAELDRMVELVWRAPRPR